MNTPRPVWIDTDIIFNRVAQDVDDGLALMMALHSERVQVRGISLNRGVDNGARVTRRLLAHYARYEIPVYKGEDDIFSSFGRRSEAVDALAAALSRERLTVVALGAATNLANLLRFHPQAARNIERIVFCAGRQAGVSFRAGRGHTGLPDANFDNDPASFRFVLDSGLPLTLAGFEAAQAIVLNAADIRRIARNGRPGDRWVAWRLWLWHCVWRLGLGADGFIPFDACTLGALLYPECFHALHDVPVVIQERANDARRWKNVARKPYLEVIPGAEASTSSWRADFVSAATPSFKTHLMNHLLGVRA